MTCQKFMTWLVLSTTLVATTLQADTTPPGISVGTGYLPMLGTDQLPLAPDVLDQAIRQLGYQVTSVPSDGIEAFMPIGRHQDNGIPSEIEGIWWISFNPFGGEILTTLGGPASHWDQGTRTVYQDNFGTDAYSYEDDGVGRRAFLNVLLSHMQFAITFSEDYQHADLRLSIAALGQRVPLPEALVKYTMDLVEEGHFARHSWFFGVRVVDYQLLRIVRADGSRDPAYEDYLKQAPAKSIVVAKLN